jgi:hypothetical protein
MIAINAVSRSSSDGLDLRCDKCQQLGDTLAHLIDSGKEIRFQDYDVGTYKEISSKPRCPMCAFLARLLRIKCRESETLEKSADHVTFNYLSSDLHNALFIHLSGLTDTIYALPLDRPWHETHVSGRLVKEEEISIPLLREWISCCDSWHGKECGHEPEDIIHLHLPETVHFRLVDVQRQCIVQAPRSAEYVALSYVWGGFDSLRLTSANHAILGKPQILTSDAEGLGATIRDAMTLVLSLGKRFLWIDQLCIVQDDEEEKYHQISVMDSIYRCATLTIIAADGTHADHGLRGTGNGAKRRKFLQETVEYAPGRRMVIVQSELCYSFNNKKVPWYQRAWTFQEGLFSRRVLVFLNDSVHFRCQKMVWCEEVLAERKQVTRYFQMAQFFDICKRDAPKMPDSNNWVTSLHHSKWPNMHQYRSLVWQYGNKRLSYQSDILRAFAGVTRFLSYSFAGGFYFGLPELFFDNALLWQGGGNIMRQSRSADGEPESYLPSWSWAGWAGRLDSTDWDFDEKVIRDSHSWSAEGNFDHTATDRSYYRWTKPVIEWHKFDNRSGNRPTFDLVNNLAQKHRHFMRDDGTFDLPDGWNRHAELERPCRTYPEYQQKFYYTHKSDAEATFFYPLPLVSESNPTQNRENAYPYLKFRTRSAFFQLQEGKYPSHQILAHMSLLSMILDGAE